MKRRGRPPLDGDTASVKVTISLPAKQFDDFCKHASNQQVSVPEVIRQALRPNKTLKNRQPIR
jgi:hypothetical protein